MNDKDIIKQAKNIVDIEIKNLEKLKDYLGGNFISAVKMIYNCTGKIVITGMGKSGIVGKKISTTFASTGTPSIFLHPGEAIHGDLGVVCPNDIVIAVSNSGETPEILRILPSLQKIGARIISLTSGKKSSMSLQSSLILNTGPVEEADPFGIIPSSSATVALVLGDALAFTLLTLKGFQKEDYAFYHPGGNLGKRLLLRVKDVMQTGHKIPRVRINDSLVDVVKEINRKNMGFTLVEDEKGKLAGIITDGDLRRLLTKTSDISCKKASECMAVNPKDIAEGKRAV
ncbi:MAG: KpsF/GutQ family sugar-phosphate isomerase, partial [Candidatus Omnitrophica bacterium]|nr:KpsF/GutQ family sugar-phosphate isomerase [Candidatus Omnitrophota bacterium]